MVGDSYMRRIDNITASASQVSQVLLGDGTSFQLALRYHGATQRWVADVEYEDRTIQNLGLCIHPNVLRQWSRVFPFGIAVVSSGQVDPFDVNDFATGRVSLYLLDQDDVTAVEDDVFGAEQ